MDGARAVSSSIPTERVLQRGSDRSRTCDIFGVSEALYQLSYRTMFPEGTDKGEVDHQRAVTTGATRVRHRRDMPSPSETVAMHRSRLD